MASWVPVVLASGVLVLLAALFLLPWVDADEGQFTDVRHGLISADDAGAEVDGWLLAYVEWGIWAVAGLSVVTALAAVYGRRRMSTGVRLALVLVVSGLVVAPIMLITLAGQALDQSDGDDGTGMPMTGGLVVAFVLIALFIGSTFVRAHVVTAVLAGAGVLWHLHALNELSDADADLDLGVMIGWTGYVALAIAALAARRRHSPRGV